MRLDAVSLQYLRTGDGPDWYSCSLLSFKWDSRGAVSVLRHNHAQVCEGV